MSDSGMSLVVETGDGIVGANSYASAEMMDVYWNGRAGRNLLRATVPDVPGFSLYAYSMDELVGKIGAELKKFLSATKSGAP